MNPRQTIRHGPVCGVVGCRAASFVVTVPGSPVPPSGFTVSQVVAGLCNFGNIVPGSCDAGLCCFGNTVPGLPGVAMFVSQAG